MHVAVIGAGAIGLTTAWYLRERGVEVSVFEMEKPANGASWGNAGQILPIKSVPLSEPGNLKYALKSFFKKSAHCLCESCSCGADEWPGLVEGGGWRCRM